MPLLTLTKPHFRNNYLTITSNHNRCDGFFFKVEIAVALGERVDAGEEDNCLVRNFFVRDPRASEVGLVGFIAMEKRSMD